MAKGQIKGYYFGHSYSFIAPENAEIDLDQTKDKEPDSVKI